MKLSKADKEQVRETVKAILIIGITLYLGWLLFGWAIYNTVILKG